MFVYTRACITITVETKTLIVAIEKDMARRVRDFPVEDLEGRYKLLTERVPVGIGRVSQSILASDPGVTPESVSKMKRKSFQFENRQSNKD